jgi:transcription elongation factor Elf1
MPMVNGSGRVSTQGSCRMTCPSCERTQLVEIALKVGDEPVRMRSCSRCDLRWWDRGGELIPVSGILDLVRAG